MGCDIHVYAEAKKDGKWESVDKWVDEYGEGPDAKYDSRLYTGRNYVLFSFLADVRNGHGFAGVDTGDRIEPICAPKGVPDDCDARIAKACDDWGCDGHSHSWLTIGELKSADWLRTITQRGFVGPSDFRRWDYFGKPENWWGGISGPRIQFLSNSGMQEMFPDWKAVRAYEEKNSTPRHYTQVQWKTLLAVVCERFIVDTIPALERHGDSRIVFWFDN